MLNELLSQIFEGFMMHQALSKGTMVPEERGSKCSLVSVILSSVASGLITSSMWGLSCLAAYNIRWKHLIPFLLSNDKPQKLPYRKVEAEDDKTTAKSIV